MIFKEVGENLYYKLGEKFIKLNAEGLEEAVKVLQEQFNRFQGLPVSHITFNNNQGSMLRELANNPTPTWFMQSPAPGNIFNQINSVPDPIGGVGGRNNWEAWPNSPYHQVYSASEKTYVMKFAIPSSIMPEDRKRTIVEVSVNSPAVDSQLMICYHSNDTGWIRRTNIIKKSNNVAKLYYHLQEGPTDFYVMFFNRGGGIPSIRLLSLDNAQEHLTSGPYDAKPASPVQAQQYFCIDYNSATRSGGGTEKQLLIYNGSAWQKANE